MKRPLPDGTTHLLFTELELLRRVTSLVPPPRTNSTRYHGVFAPGAKLRPFLVPTAAPSGEEEAPAAGAAAVDRCGGRRRAPRLDLRGVAPQDVCSGCLRVPEVQRHAPRVGLPHARPRGASSVEAPEAAGHAAAPGPNTGPSPAGLLALRPASASPPSALPAVHRASPLEASATGGVRPDLTRHDAGAALNPPFQPPPPPPRAPPPPAHRTQQGLDVSYAHKVRTKRR
jgi:Putative transposase